ncbi:hypothetical protein [Pseudobacteriovorax antillogorgiicola]|uniref:Uncharacterized protein n=1 Tax=Pseudobacteriovorax antillogorgiicola TaxID=1513793 RepID=A0A1Y6CQE9_9BACT|nr:hypothetical protein [Pseudobacteriovorax antillogorgiicola]TCS45930.1 hypothetical protein EDD56_12693 [Pseudobacteriovorax antillogorgiicola]SMF71004.1 hypothetical protein SAMN06296036_1265 [Pseudobacteriovorax antillogorgiicola]
MGLGIIAATLFAGLSAADFTITIGEMATQGSFIDPHINDRRQVLSEKYEKALSLQDEFIDTLRSTQRQVQATSISIQSNRQILQNVEDVFSYIPETVVEDLESPEFTVHQEVLDYIVGSPQVLLDSFPKEDLNKYFRKTRTFAFHLNQIALEHLGFDDLSLQGKQMIAPTGALKRPINISNLKVLSASLKTRMNAAISVASIATQIHASVKRRQEIDATIKGLQNVIDLLEGRLEPNSQDYKIEVDEDYDKVIINLPELHQLQITIQGIRNWDLEVYHEMADFFFQSHQEDGDKLLINSSQGNIKSNLFYSIFLQISKDGAITSADQITWVKMKGQQSILVPLLIDANLDLILLSTTANDSTISAKDITRIVQACQSLGDLGMDVVYDHLLDTFGIQNEIADQVILSDLGGQCK